MPLNRLHNLIVNGTFHSRLSTLHAAMGNTQSYSAGTALRDIVSVGLLIAVGDGNIIQLISP